MVEILFEGIDLTTLVAYRHVNDHNSIARAIIGWFTGFQLFAYKDIDSKLEDSRCGCSHLL